jgi:hypothetical protein
MEIKHEQIRGYHDWIKENMRDEDGNIYGIGNCFYRIHIDGVHVGEVFNGELKASSEDRKHKSNGDWWVAVKDGKIVGPMVKSRKKAIENLKGDK